MHSYRDPSSREPSSREPSDREPSDREPSDREPSDREPSDRASSDRWYRDIQAHLEERRRSLDRRLREMEDCGLVEAPPEQAGDEDLAHLLASSRELLGCIDASLQRIADRTFDICIHCGSQIARRQLETHPFTASCESCTGGYRWDYLGRISAQHDDLERLVQICHGGVTILVEVSRSGDTAERRHRIATSLLGILRRELAEHFALEEAQGALGAAVEAAPRLAREASRLQDQHTDLLAGIDELIGLARAPRPAAETCEALAARFALVREEFLAHERAENEIIAGAFLDDLGGGD